MTLLNWERFKLYFKHTRKDLLLEYKMTWINFSLTRGSKGNHWNKYVWDWKIRKTHSRISQKCKLPLFEGTACGMAIYISLNLGRGKVDDLKGVCQPCGSCLEHKTVTHRVLRVALSLYLLEELKQGKSVLGFKHWSLSLNPFPFMGKNKSFSLSIFSIFTVSNLPPSPPEIPSIKIRHWLSTLGNAF